MAQAGVGELRLAALAEGLEGRLDPPLRVAVDGDLGLVVREAERVERVVDARGVEGGQRAAAAAVAVVVVQLRQVEAARLLGRRLAILGRGPAGQALFFLGEEGVALGLLARRIGFLGGLGLSLF